MKSLLSMLKDSLLAAIAAFALALPLVGFRTVDQVTGVALATRWFELVLCVAFVFCGRFLLLLLHENNAHKHKGQTQISSVFTAKSIQFLNKHGIYGLLAVAIIFPFLPFTDRYMLDISIMVLTYVTLAWGLTIVVGYAGLLDLGYVAFYGIGAYSFALMAQHFGFTFWQALPFSALVAALIALLLGMPVLRLRGDYLAIVTVGFAEITRIILINWTNFTGGPNGISDIPRPSLFGVQFGRPEESGPPSFSSLIGVEYSSMQRVIYFYFLALLLAGFVAWLASQLRRSPVGRSWEAIRQDEIAAVAMGINPTRAKLAAYVIGAAVAGIVGAVFATRQGFISPESFSFMESVTVLAIIVLGGLGNLWGALFATIFIIGLPELFRDLEQYRMVAFGLGMIIIMLWRPQGLLAYREPTIVLPKTNA